MRGFGARRRSAGARRTSAARTTRQHLTTNAFGRKTRNLVGATRGSDGRRTSFGRARRFASLRGITRIASPARAAALLGMLASGFAFTLVTGPTAFGLSRTELPDLAWTSTEDVSAALSLREGSNVFRLDTLPLEQAIEALPAVAAAHVTVALPDAAVVVTIEERAPVLAWQIGDARFLADREGAIFARIDASAAVPAGVAVVEDRRIGAAGRTVIGGHLDPVDLDVATRLGSLVPADVGSNAARLRVVVNQTDGFLVRADEDGWAAVFGFYSPATRATDIVPGQVRLLRSLLAGRESQILRVILASETDGTYVPRATPKPSRS